MASFTAFVRVFSFCSKVGAGSKLGAPEILYRDEECAVVRISARDQDLLKEQVTPNNTAYGKRNRCATCLNMRKMTKEF